MTSWFHLRPGRNAERDRCAAGLPTICWGKPCKVVTRIEVTSQGLDIRYVVTSPLGRAPDRGAINA